MGQAFSGSRKRKKHYEPHMPRTGKEDEIVDERPSHEIDLSVDEKGKGAKSKKLYKGPSTEGKRQHADKELDLSVDEKGSGPKGKTYEPNWPRSGKEAEVDDAQPSHEIDLSVDDSPSKKGGKSAGKSKIPKSKL